MLEVEVAEHRKKCATARQKLLTTIFTNDDVDHTEWKGLLDLRKMAKTGY